MRSDYISHSSSLSSSSINRKRKSDRGTSRERLKPDPGSTTEADLKRSKSGQSSPSNGQQPLLVSVLNPSTDEKKSRSKSKSKLASKSPKSDRHHRSERKHRDRRKDTNGVTVSSGGGVQTDASGLMITSPVTVPNIKLIVKQTKLSTPVPSPMAQIQTVSFYYKVTILIERPLFWTIICNFPYKSYKIITRKPIT